MIKPEEANLEYRGEVKKVADTILEMCKKAAIQTPQGERICFTFEEGRVAKSPYRSPELNSQLIEEAMILVKESVLKAGWENFKFEEAEQIDPLNPSRRGRELSFAPPPNQTKEGGEA